MKRRMDSTRRWFLTAVGGFASLAGCAEMDRPISPTNPPDDTTTDSPLATTTDGQSRTAGDPKPLEVSGAWPQKGSDPGHSGVTSATGVPATAEPYWQLPRGQSGETVVADEYLIHTAHGFDDHTPAADVHLVCRDSSQGRIQWIRPHVSGSQWHGVSGENVVAAGTGVIVAYRVTDGTEQWRHDIENRRAKVSTAVDGTVLVSTELSRETNRASDVRAYRVADGTRRWVRSSPKQLATVAASGDTVLTLSSKFKDGSVLTARSLNDGSERWSVAIDDNGIPDGPFAAGERVYVTPDNGGVLAYDLATGDQHWHYAAETSNIVGLAATERTAFLVDDVGLRVHDANDGAERWSATADGDRHFTRMPAVSRDTVYLGTSGAPADFVALSREDGSKRWRYKLPTTIVNGDQVKSGLVTQPTVVDRAIFAFAQDGLYAFGPSE